MKSSPIAIPSNKTRLRKNPTNAQNLEEFHRIAHNLCNQLSVINLCSFKIVTLLRSVAGAQVEKDLETLERAVGEAADLASRLAVSLEPNLRIRSHRHAAATGDVCQDAGKVVRLFPSAADPDQPA